MKQTLTKEDREVVLKTIELLKSTRTLYIDMFKTTKLVHDNSRENNISLRGFQENNPLDCMECKIKTVIKQIHKQIARLEDFIEEDTE